MVRRFVALPVLVVVAVALAAAGACAAARFLLGGGAPAGETALRPADRLLAGVAERWQREAATFLQAGEATFTVREEEASALLGERLAGASLGSWQVRGAGVRFEPGVVLMELSLVPRAGLFRFVLGAEGAAVGLTFEPALVGEAVEVRLAGARVGRLTVSPVRVADLVTRTTALPPGIVLERERASLRLTPRDLVAGIPLVVDRLQVGEGNLVVGVRATPRGEER